MHVSYTNSLNINWGYMLHDIDIETTRLSTFQIIVFQSNCSSIARMILIDFFFRLISSNTLVVRLHFTGVHYFQIVSKRQTILS